MSRLRLKNQESQDQYKLIPLKSDKYEHDIDEQQSYYQNENINENTIKNKLIKPTLTRKWIVIFIVMIIMTLANLSTIYLTIKAWNWNNNVNDNIKTFENNVETRNNNFISSTCLLCVDNHDGSFSTWITSEMELESNNLQSQFQTGVNIDNINFSPSGITSKNANTIFLFDNNLGSSSNLVSYTKPGLITLPFKKSSSTTNNIGSCSSSNVIASSLYFYQSSSNDEYLCICDPPQNECVLLN